MALVDPNIAMSYRGIEIPNQLAQYGQLAQIQNAQNQNSLAQYQLGAAQRQDAAQNAMSEAWKASVNAETGAVDEKVLIKNMAARGAAHLIPDMQSKMLESQVKKATLKKTQTETDDKEFDLKKKRLDRSFTDLTNFNTIGDVLGHIKKQLDAGEIDQITAQQLASQVPQSDADLPKFQIAMLRKTLGAKDQLELSKQTTKDTDRGGYIERQTYDWQGKPVGNPVKLPKTATIADTIAQGRLGVERERLAQDATGVVYQEDANGNVIALPSKLKKGEVPTARIAVAPGGGFQPLQGKPSEAVGKEQLSINQQKTTVQGAIDAVKSAPEAFGWVTGNMPESARARLASTEENEARAFVFNVVSGVIKERAGTAQSAGEAATLARFLPAEGDNAKVIEDKLTGFQKYLNAKEAGTTKKRSGGNPPNLPAGGGGVDTSNPLLK